MPDEDNTSRRRFLEATGGVASVVALAGCGGGPSDSGSPTATEGSTDAPTETSQPDDTATPGGTEGEDTATSTPQQDWDPSKTVRSISGTMDTMDPIKSTDTTSGAKIQNIFDALTNYPNGQTNVENLLAKDFQSANGGKSLTFTLKEGVTYSNGDEVTAQDFVYSWERLAASPNSRRAGFILNDLGVKHETTTTTNDKGKEVTQYKPGSLAVTAADDYTLEVELAGPFPATLELLAYTAFSAIPEGIVGDIEGYSGDMKYQTFAKKNPIGSGPYTLEKWSSGTEMVLSARDSYHAGELRNSGIRYKILSEVNAMWTYASVNVNADFPVIPNNKFKKNLVNIEGTDDRGRRYGTYGPFGPNNMTARYTEVEEVGTFYTGFNCANVPKPVRQAWAYAYNPKTFAENIRAGPEKNAYFFTPPSIFPGGRDRYNKMAKEYPYGYETGMLDKARQVMEDAGYGSNNMHDLTLDMPASVASSYGQQYFNLMRDKLRSAHINLSLSTAKWSTFLNKGRKGNFEAHWLGWIADWPRPDNFLKLLYPPQTDTESKTFQSYLNWSPENGDAAQQAIDAWEKVQNNLGASDQALQARQEAYIAIEKANWEDMAMMTQFHSIVQNYEYQWVSSPRNGAMGGSRSKDHTIGIGDRGKWE